MINYIYQVSELDGFDDRVDLWKHHKCINTLSKDILVQCGVNNNILGGTSVWI